MAQFITDFENGVRETVWSEEQERMPLKQRLKLLLASHRISLESDVKFGVQNSGNVANNNIADGNKLSNLQFSCSSEKQRLEAVLTEQSHEGELGVYKNQENRVDEGLNSTQSITAAVAAPSQDVDSVYCNLRHEPLFSSHNIRIKSEPYEDCVVGSSCDLNSSTGVETQAANMAPEISVESLDELDHVALKERLKRLLASKSLGLTALKLEENSSGKLSLVSETSHLQADGAGKREKRIAAQRLSANGNQIHEIDLSLKSDSSKSHLNSSTRSYQAVNLRCEGKLSPSAGQGFQIDDHMSFSRKDNSKYEPQCGKTLVSEYHKAVQGSAPLNSTEARIKFEPPDNNVFESSSECKTGQFTFMNLVQVKNEVEISSDSDKDELDHMSLTERMKLLPSKYNMALDIPQFSESTKTRVPSPLSSSPVGSRTDQFMKVKHPRKRRKTATDSVETAMEEDAPGLLQVLIDKGVSIGEIKLYGEPESNEALDDSSADDNFVELEEVIAKLWSQRESFLKFGPLRCRKGEKANYCLECLFSLVEQARYLRFRNWPVEWGWCRDLQSFIFVFERHNRIVLERPEYGYATYFFELSGSLPIDWQVKRLITAMKLTSCSRITLIENKALMVGDDLTEGEAKVLIGYGWIPNTGLGTMLNYYGRVVHDRKNEKEQRSEWRSKIGKLLMDGYNGGSLVSAEIPSKVMEYNVVHPVQIKLELN